RHDDADDRARAARGAVAAGVAGRSVSGGIMSIPGFPGLELAEPWLLLLLIVPVLLAIWRWKGVRRPALRIPTTDAVDGLPRTMRLRLRWLPIAGRVVALALLAVALARPRGGEVIESVTAEGVDIMIALDTSGSMLG